MSKHTILTREELAAFSPADRVLEFIEACRAQLGLAKKDVRILDWGCGRGLTVAWLRRSGYDARGVDIDTVPLHNARECFLSLGHDPDKALLLLGPGNTTDFESGFFHLIISGQVIEHVRDLDSMAREVSRLMAPGGLSMHTYPPHRLIIEPHLFMPLVHWLPPGVLRRLTVYCNLILGRDPGWPQLAGKAITQRVAGYSEYLDEKTHYRKWTVIRDTFQKHGLSARFTGWRDRFDKRSGLLWAIASIPPLSYLVDALFLNVLGQQELILEKNGEKK